MSNDLLGNNVSSYVEWSLENKAYPKFAKNFFKAGDVSNLGGAINVTYGALVYDQVNRESNAHAILKKEPWERSGFRVTTSDPNTKGAGGADPDADTASGSTQGTVASNIDTSPTELDSIPGFLHSPFNLTTDAGFRAQHDDGLDVWEWKLAVMRDIHSQLLNEELVRSAHADSNDIGANATSDAKNDANSNAKGLETIDRHIASDQEDDDLASSNDNGHYDPYEGDVDRSATTFDSVVARPDGSKNNYNQNLTWQLDGWDTIIDDTEDNGADPTAQVFLTGRDTRRAFYRELQSQGRYDLTSVQAKLDMDGLSTTATHPGRDITFTIRAYQDRPIVADKKLASNGTNDFDDDGENGGTGLTHTYLIDQRHAHMKVGFPTLYVDVDNPVIRGQFDTRALYLTCEQSYFTRYNVHGKQRSAD
jgi:hypothetical protein